MPWNATEWGAIVQSTQIFANNTSSLDLAEPSATSTDHLIEHPNSEFLFHFDKKITVTRKPKNLPSLGQDPSLCVSMGYLVQLVAIPAGPLPPGKRGTEIQPVDAPSCTEVTALAAAKGTVGPRAAWRHCRIEGQRLKPVGTGSGAFCGVSMAWAEAAHHLCQ